MEQSNIHKLKEAFEAAAYLYEYEQGSIEYWYSRELQELLEYNEWRNFNKVIDKAKEACKNASQSISEHFVDVNKTLKMPKGGTKSIKDIVLTRYACYLIAQNGDSRKETVAFAQSYFALQTRKQEFKKEFKALTGIEIVIKRD